MRKTPPSGFELKMGAASCINTNWDMTFVDQHWRSQWRSEQLCAEYTLFHSSWLMS